MANPGDIEAVLQIKDQMSQGLTSIAAALGRLESSFKSVQSTILATNKTVAQFADSAANLTTQLGGWGKVHFDRIAELKKISERLNNARTVMIGYGNATRQAAASQLPLASGMEAVDGISNKQIARLTKLTFKIVALQTSTFSLGSVAAHAGENVKRGFDAAHVSLAAFVGIATFATGKIGLLTGGVIGLLAGLTSFILSAPSATERFKGLADAISVLRQSLFESSEEITKNMDILLLAGSKPSEVGEATLQKLISNFETIRSLMPDLTDKLIGFNGVINKTKEAARGLGFLPGYAPIQELLDKLGVAIGERDLQKIRDITFAVHNMMTTISAASKDGLALRGPLESMLVVVADFIQSLDRLQKAPIDIVAQRISNLLAKSKEEAVGFQDALRDIQQIGEASQGLGIENSLELARQRAQAASKQVSGLLEMVQKLKIASRDQTITDQQRKEILDQINRLIKSSLGAAISENRLAEENLKLQERIFKVKEKIKEMDVKFGFAKAIEEFTDEFKTLKDLFKDVFSTMEDAFSNAFQAMMGSGKKFRDSMRQVFKDVGNAFKKMISEFLANNLMRELLMAIMPSRVVAPGVGLAGVVGAGIGGGIGGGVGGGIGAVAGGAGSQQNLNPGVGLLTGGLFNPANSLLGLSSGLLGGVGLAGVLGASQAQDPVSGGLMGAAGGAMAGFAIGGPIGAAIGGIGAGLMGLFSGDKAKEEEEKAKEAEEEAAQQAAEELERQRAIAQDFVIAQIQNRYGGGLATKEAAVSLGALMSSGLSVAELESFGTPAELAAQAQMAGGVNVGGIQNHFQITAYIGGQYDVQRLGEDLGQAIIGSVDSAVAGGV